MLFKDIKYGDEFVCTDDKGKILLGTYMKVRTPSPVGLNTVSAVVISERTDIFSTRGDVVELSPIQPIQLVVKD